MPVPGSRGVAGLCELFAMSSRLPAGVRFSFREFAAHGGLSGPHADGWGIAWYEDRDVRVMREPVPAARSACVRFVEANDLEATLVLSHIRRATRGRVCLANTQPFARELAGYMHVFAHNGDLPELDHALVAPAGAAFHPVGQTDSEYAFCTLLETLQAAWKRCAGPPPLDQRLAVIAAFAERLRRLGPANFLYADGDALFAHGHRRRHDDGVRPPGLWMLRRRCREPGQYRPDGVAISSTTGDQEVVLLASVPLSDEGWSPLAEGEVLALRRGAVVGRLSPLSVPADPARGAARCSAPGGVPGPARGQ